MPKTAKKTVDTAAANEAIADAVRNLFAVIAVHAPSLNGVAVAASAKSDDADEAEEVEDDEEEEETELTPLDRDEVEALGIKDLRALAKEYGVSETKKADILAALDEGGMFSDSEEEDDEDEDEADEEEGYSRDELEEMDLKELRAVAKESGFTASDYKGMDQDALIDLLLGEESEDEDADEEDEDEEEDDDEEEVEELDEDALNGMSLTELKALAKEIGVKVKVPASAKTEKAKQKVYVEAILDSGDEE